MAIFGKSKLMTKGCCIKGNEEGRSCGFLKTLGSVVVTLHGPK